MKRHILLTLLATLCLGLVFNTPALAENKRAKAKRLFDEGVAALDEHDYRKALDAFDAAYEASPHWMVLAHIGTCHSKLNNPVKAISALEKYLEEGGENIEASEREAARKLLAEQRNKVGTLRLIVDLPHAEGRIDGDSIGQAPFEKQLLKAGPHHLIVIQGSNVMEKEFLISPGQEMMIRLPEKEKEIFPEMAAVPKPTTAAPLTAKSEPTPSAMAEEQAEPPSIPDWPQEQGESTKETESDENAPIFEIEDMPDGTSVPFYVALGFTAAGAVTAALGWSLFGYYYSSEGNYAAALNQPSFDSYTWNQTCYAGKVKDDNGNYQTDCPTTDEKGACEYYCDNEAYRRDLASRAETSLIPAIVGTAVGVAAGGTALLFYFHPEWFTSSTGDVSWHITPVANASQTGLVFSGTF